MPLTLDQIREFWTSQAQSHGESPSASWSDHSVILMEIRKILEYLADGDRVLDIGCANGYSTVQFASQRNITISGVDYVPEMIEHANARLRDMPDLTGRVAFRSGDITALNEPSAAYDKVVVTRVVINLGTWDNQLVALRECIRVLKPGGMLLLSEATLQGWNKLNSFRAEWQLPAIPMPEFNHYLDEAKVIDAVRDELTLLEVANFASSYYVATRVLKPLLIRSLGLDIDVANPNMHWNSWCAALPAAGDYGTQKLFVFKKP
jgi:ubiquinone/menaquinone biosynthesis C-methylase UbiE